MLKILHTADIHLDAPFLFLGEKGAVHRRQIRETFARITDLAAAERYDLLLIAGDLFDSNRPSRDTQRFAMKTLGDAPLPVVILPGNHDPLDAQSAYHRLDLPPNLRLLAKRPAYLAFPDLDLTVAGNPILSRHDDTQQLADISRSDSRWFVAMAHGNMQLPGYIESTSRPIEPTSIAATGADYVALGDWHKFADYSQDGVHAFYAGAPEPTTMAQDKTGTVASVTLSDQGVKVEPRQIGAVEVCSLSLSVSGLSETDIVAAIRAEANPNRMTSVTLKGLKTADHMLDLEAIHEETASDFYWVEINDEAIFGAESIDPDDFPEAFVIGQYVRLLAERIENAADERERRVAERALRLGVALLQGEKVF